LFRSTFTCTSSKPTLVQVNLHLYKQQPNTCSGQPSPGQTTNKYFLTSTFTFTSSNPIFVQVNFYLYKQQTNTCSDNLQLYKQQPITRSDQPSPGQTKNKCLLMSTFTFTCTNPILVQVNFHLYKQQTNTCSGQPSSVQAATITCSGQPSPGQTTNKHKLRSTFTCTSSNPIQYLFRSTFTCTSSKPTLVQVNLHLYKQQPITCSGQPSPGQTTNKHLLRSPLIYTRSNPSLVHMITIVTLVKTDD
jgi:hypothetical protein